MMECLNGRHSFFLTYPGLIFEFTRSPRCASTRLPACYRAKPPGCSVCAPLLAIHGIAALGRPWPSPWRDLTLRRLHSLTLLHS